jgi:hypothetical protein
MTTLSRAERRVEPAVFAPGTRAEIRGEEWMVRKSEQTSTGDTAVHVTGLSELVRNKMFFPMTAPFDSCDREADMVQAYRYFADKLGIHIESSS